MLSTRSTTVLRQARFQFRSSLFSATPQFTSYARLLSSLAILEQRDGKLNGSSLAAVTAAQKLGGPIHAFVAGAGTKAVAEEAAKVEGIEKILYVDSAAYDKGLAESFAPLVVENIKKGGYTHVLAGHSAFGKNLMPRVAALLDSQGISDITAIEGEDTFVRPIYAGNAILTVQSQDSIKIITVRGTAFPAAEPTSGTATVEEGVDPKDATTTEWLTENLTKSDRPELASAGRVVSGGRGLKSKEEFDRIMPPLADALGAAIGASRAAVDSGFADNSLQVGQTGKNVAPQLYLCAGISGAIQHLAGMKDSKVIAAINKDPEAPIFQVADVGLVGDLFDKVPELTEKLKQ
ncbi:electron transfer flavo protein-like protein subunit alpha [Microthyrium microscopicum]|uniref:Probable electron transfer flavoprotein subunit alpha n=1 Tax=Microthyrium microscopicum TaxID=703497 RepID=A0A6A6U9T3_9PEZI|nr:electron transfer flavo protein-like protein subunit alpha [Microthyrium microscopicum]